MTFEDEISELARQQQANEARAAEHRRQLREASQETIAGFVRLLQAHGFEPAPLYAEVQFHRARVLWDTQSFEHVGQGWHLTVPGDGGNGSLALLESGRFATSAWHVAPGEKHRSLTGTAYRGLPRRGAFVVVHGSLARDDRGLDGDEERAVRAAAVEIVKGARQKAPGSADRWL